MHKRPTITNKQALLFSPENSVVIENPQKAEVRFRAVLKTMCIRMLQDMVPQKSMFADSIAPAYGTDKIPGGLTEILFLKAKVKFDDRPFTPLPGHYSNMMCGLVATLNDVKNAYPDERIIILSALERPHELCRVQFNLKTFPESLSKIFAHENDTDENKRMRAAVCIEILERYKHPNKQGGFTAAPHLH